MRRATRPSAETGAYGRRLRQLRTALAGALLGLARPAPAMPPSPPEAPLFGAIDAKDLKKVQALLKAGADVYARDEGGGTALERAALADDQVLVRYLLGLAPDLDARDLYGNAALHYAAQNGAGDIVRALLGAGAEPRLENHRCQSPLDFAAGFGHKDLFIELLPAAAAARLPADGTVEECQLTAVPPAYESAKRAFQQRQLEIDEPDDQSVAQDMLEFLGAHPDDGATVLPAVLAVVTNPTPGDALDDPALDLGVREDAVRALAKIARTKAARADVAAALLKVVEGGGCPAYKARQCRAGSLAGCAKPGAGKEPPWPRDPKAERCFSCRHCEDSAAGHGFTAALGWFYTDPDPSHRAAAGRALDRLRAQDRLPKAEHRKLRARLGPSSEPLISR